MCADLMDLCYGDGYAFIPEFLYTKLFCPRGDSEAVCDNILHLTSEKKTN